MLRKLVNRWSTRQTAQTNASMQLESALNLDRHCLLFFFPWCIHYKCLKLHPFCVRIISFRYAAVKVLAKGLGSQLPFLEYWLARWVLITPTGIMNACQLLWRKLQEGFKQVHVGVFSGTCFTLTNARISRMELKQFQWFGTSNDPILVQCPIILGS